MRKVFKTTTLLLAVVLGAMFMYVHLSDGGVKKITCERLVTYEGSIYCVDGMGIKSDADFERIDKLGKTKVKNHKNIEWVEELR